MTIPCGLCGVTIDFYHSRIAHVEAIGVLDVCNACKAKLNTEQEQRVRREGWRAVGIVVAMVLGLLGLVMVGRGC